MKSPSVLVIMEPVSLPRLEGIAKFAREHKWNLMLDDRLTGGISDWRGDGVIATLRSRSSRLASIRKLRRLGIPVVDLTVECKRLKLDHLFAEKLGHSVGTEIYSRRIAHVKHKLEDPSIPVNAIATECGFCNVAYLSNVFRRETGLSPRAWREKVKGAKA